jgi:hypothetical protein
LGSLRLIRILKEAGAAPNVTEESHSEPSLDFAWGPVPGHGLTARQWAEDWLGQAVAVLGFHTPRRAAEGGKADRLRLEGLLRQLEYQSALPAERGGWPIDTPWLRAELGLESMQPTRGSCSVPLSALATLLPGKSIVLKVRPVIAGQGFSAGLILLYLGG